MAVRAEQRGAVTLVTLDRPEALNALSNAVLEELIEVFSAFGPTTASAARC
jgi:enoyl-CoA hydratase